ncbi:MAG: chromosome segregation protein SMC, partial [Bdellovibrio sp.]
PRLQMLVSSGADHSIQAIDYLKEKKLGRSSFLNTPQASELNALPKDQGVLASLYSKLKVPEKFSAIAQSLVGSIAVVDSIRTALRLRSLHPGWSFVTQEGDVLSPDGVLSGGTPESADSGLMKRKTEMKDLTRQKDEWSGKLALAQAALKTLEEQFAHASQEFDSVIQRKMNQEIRVAELKKDLERAETEHANSQGIIQKQDRDCQKLAQQSKEAQEKIQSLDLRVDDLKTQRQVKEEQSQGLLEDYETEKLGFDQFQEQVTEMQVQAASLKQELQGLLNQENYFERNIRDLEEQLNRIQGESQKNSLVMDEGHLNLERARLDFDQLIQDLEQSKQTLAQKKNEFEVEGGELRVLEKNLQDSQKKLHDNSARMNEAQLKLEQARMKEQYLVDQIRERYLVELSEVYKTKMNREVSSAVGSSAEDLRAEGEKELLELKEKLSKIGDVNLSAIQEYEENGKRYEFLLRQQQDLNSAQDQLRRVIDRINKICSKRFKETFELVNERFQKVFPVLFGGGEAYLELIEDVEKGEMGIEIVAKPPGKKMQNITLLSGGEKALTAVSLVFSIFLVKPSPYGLLDEVDAPLDDANVFRFNDLVREMAKRSQIIVVTHNKHTMEVAAQLYGVTMQEKGVSTMVSVNLNAMAPSVSDRNA